jgi:hypothetical protein
VSVPPDLAEIVFRALFSDHELNRVGHQYAVRCTETLLVADSIGQLGPVFYALCWVPLVLRLPPLSLDPGGLPKVTSAEFIFVLRFHRERIGSDI